MVHLPVGSFVRVLTTKYLIEALGLVQRNGRTWKRLYLPTRLLYGGPIWSRDRPSRPTDYPEGKRRGTEDTEGEF